MPEYNPNSIWTSKDNPNLPRSARSAVKSSTPTSMETSSLGAASSSPVADSPEASLPQHPAPRQRSFFARHGLIIFSISLFVVFAGAIAAVILLRAPSKPVTSLTIAPPSGVTVGTPFVANVSASNSSNVTLTNAVIALQLPDGISFIGEDPSMRTKEYTLGDLAAGAIGSQSSTLIVTGSSNTLMAVSAKLLYNSTQTPSTTYETDAATSFSAGSSMVSMSYTAPSNIVSGQSFSMTVNYVNGGAQTIADAAIVMKYAPAFVFSTSSIAVATGTNNKWEIGSLASGQGGSFTITGVIVGPTQTQYSFTGSVMVGISGQQYAINTQPVNFTLVSPPLALAIVANNSSTYVSKTSDDIDYKLTYTNNSNVTLASVNITANLIGSMYDFTSLQTNGSFSSKTNTITWVAANAPALASVAPGQSGSVTFSIKTKDSFPIKLLSDKNYTLNITGTVQSPTVLPNTSGTSTISVTKIQNKIGGAMALTSKGYWQSGPYPPRVDQATLYTINWAITNYATDASSVTVLAYLQSGATFLGVVTSTVSSSVPVYDPGTGLVTWKIPSIAAGTGIVGAPMRASFTVSDTPAVNEVGGDVTLLGTASLSATDVFTGGAFSLTAAAVTTALPDDKSLSASSRQVIQ